MGATKSGRGKLNFIDGMMHISRVHLGATAAERTNADIDLLNIVPSRNTEVFSLWSGMNVPEYRFRSGLCSGYAYTAMTTTSDCIAVITARFMSSFQRSVSTMVQRHLRSMVAHHLIAILVLR